MSKDTEYNRETFFPFSILEEVIFILKEKECSFVTYSDFNLNLIHPRLDRLSYLMEFVNFNLNDYNKFDKAAELTKILLEKLFFKKKLFNFLSQANKRLGPVVVLQHDADQQPYKTVDMMNYEKSLGVISSSYFFKKQNFDPEETYKLDIEELKALENQGFEIGYHLNAYELAEYDLIRTKEIINEDIAYFEKNFNLRTFVPHGGHPSKNGQNNDNIAYEGLLRKYSWCYNGLGFCQNESWSDGNIYFEDIEDPRKVAARLTKGQRGMFLMHPQYYGDRLSPEYHRLPVSKEIWWKNLWSL